MTKRRVWSWWWLIAVLGLAFAARAFSLEAQGLWRDEVDALRFATAPWPEVLDRFTRPGWNGPFYFLMLRGWIALTGRSAFAMRYFSTLWGLVGIALLYPLGRRMLGALAARCSLVLAVFSPYLVWYAQEVKMYTWVPALVLLTLYALDRACRRGWWLWWVVVFVATLLAVYSHILAALLIPVAGVWFLLRNRRVLHDREWGSRPVESSLDMPSLPYSKSRRSRVPIWIAGLGVLILLIFFYRPLLAWQFPLVFEQRETGYASRTLWEMVQILLGGWSAGIAGWGRSALTLGMTVTGLVGLAGLAARRQFARAAALLTWLVGPLLAVWVVSLRGPIFTDRYLIWSAPAFYLLVGAGFVQLHRISIRLGGVETGLVSTLLRLLPLALLVGVLVGDGVNLYQQTVRPIKPQFREATAYLQARRTPNTLWLFQIPYNHIVVDYYAPQPLDPQAEAPFTNWRNDDGTYQVQAEAVADQMQALTAGYDDVWLIYSEVAMWDERQLVKSWLETHGILVEQRRFHLVDLYHFHLPETTAPGKQSRFVEE
jgi:mannosyltransferase